MPRKVYSKLSPKELQIASVEFDREFVPTKPLTPAMRQQARQAKRGRPRVGKGAAAVLVSMEKGLLTAADAYAKRHKLTRSELVARGVKAVISR